MTDECRGVAKVRKRTREDRRHRFPIEHLIELHAGNELRHWVRSSTSGHRGSASGGPVSREARGCRSWLYASRAYAFPECSFRVASVAPSSRDLRGWRQCPRSRAVAREVAGG